MAAGRGRDMVKPAWMKEEQRRQAGRHSRSRSPPSRPKLRPPDREHDNHRDDRKERESGRERESERGSHRDHRDRDHRHRSRSPGLNGGTRRPREREEDDTRHRRDESQRDEWSREEKRPRQEPLRKDSPEEQAEPPVDASMAAMEAAQKALEEKEAQKVQPDFGYSGKLAEETNKVNGIALVFNEPPEARKPTRRWRLYVFKGDEPLKDPLYIHRQSCYLFGRERKIADIPTDHPSCSKQHAVIQFRLTEREGADGMMKSLVVPYIMDLGSTNGTYLNGKRIEAQRYHELLEKDAIKFGNSTREYVLLHENSAGQ